MLSLILILETITTICSHHLALSIDSHSTHCISILASDLRFYKLDRTTKTTTTENMASNGGAVTVMYKVVNSETDPRADLYNAFQMPRTGGGVTLATIKK
jgi:hypothetical protein